MAAEATAEVETAAGARAAEAMAAAAMAVEGRDGGEVCARRRKLPRRRDSRAAGLLTCVNVILLGHVALPSFPSLPKARLLVGKRARVMRRARHQKITVGDSGHGKKWSMNVLITRSALQSL